MVSGERRLAAAPPGTLPPDVNWTRPPFTIYHSQFTGFLKLFHLFARRRVRGGGKVQQSVRFSPKACPAVIPTVIQPLVFERRN